MKKRLYTWNNHSLYMGGTIRFAALSVYCLDTPKHSFSWTLFALLFFMTGASPICRLSFFPFSLWLPIHYIYTIRIRPRVIPSSPPYQASFCFLRKRCRPAPYYSPQSLLQLLPIIPSLDNDQSFTRKYFLRHVTTKPPSLENFYTITRKIESW